MAIYPQKKSLLHLVRSLPVRHPRGNPSPFSGRSRVVSVPLSATVRRASYTRDAHRSLRRILRQGDIDMNRASRNTSPHSGPGGIRTRFVLGGGAVFLLLGYLAFRQSNPS